MIQALERRGHDRVAAVGLPVSHEAQGQLKVVLSLAAEPRYLLLSLVTRHMAGSAERLFGQGLTPEKAAEFNRLGCALAGRVAYQRPSAVISASVRALDTSFMAGTSRSPSRM